MFHCLLSCYTPTPVKVAESVETHEQMSMLKQLGCEYGQGYFFSRPIIAAAAEQMIRIQTT
jgi:EAL domain-containing protein (putative c-di-GMP-specific phosphodiesterase class I)